MPCEISKFGKKGEDFIRRAKFARTEGFDVILIQFCFTV